MHDFQPGANAMPLNKILNIVLHPVALTAISLCGILFIARMDNSSMTVLYCIATVLFIASLAYVLSGRLGFSILLAWFLVGFLTVVSTLKYKIKGFSLHFYDFVMVAEDREVASFLLDSYPMLALPVLGLAIACIAGAVMLFRCDKRQTIRLPHRFAGALAAAMVLKLTFPAEASAEQRYFYYLQGRHVSAFFVSLLDLQYMFASNDFEKRIAGMAPEAPFSGDVDCGNGQRPDIIVVLEESMTDPAIFPEMPHGKAISRRMQGAADTFKPLFVETFGGGTWISNLSLMTGLSATDFGWRSPYLTMMLEGKVRGALPEMLSQCGYRTAAILPLNYTFVNEGPFLSSIGFETVLDRYDIGASSYHMRDAFYFDAASQFVEGHREQDERPLFLLVQTMIAHSPYEEALLPGVQPDAASLDPDPQTAEYLRRMVIGRQDFETFAARETARKQDRGLIVMSFGDHQTYVTLDHAKRLSGEDALARPRSMAYRTFYTVSPQTGATAPAPIDIAYLSTALLDAAGIPGSDVFKDLRRLAGHCGGRFHDCPDRAGVDRHIARRIAGGLLDLGGDDAAAPGS
ncbi:MAG: sulfatase-like hydrolase/transferase [Brucellaceae bacterium]|nr:sulfatase-like hydrolase/transferase [Notoacmeibacter sp.]MCC0025406.1 sulfatase-like hydrolase/transferase [Brucellaceae bacterium]